MSKKKDKREKKKREQVQEQEPMAGSGGLAQEVEAGMQELVTRPPFSITMMPTPLSLMQSQQEQQQREAEEQEGRSRRLASIQLAMQVMGAHPGGNGAGIGAAVIVREAAVIDAWLKTGASEIPWDDLHLR